MRNMAFAALPALALMGCSGGSEALEPGEWQTAFYVSEVTGENITEPMREEIAAELDRELAIDPICITEEQAASPEAVMFLPSEVSEECTITESSVENGTIEMAGTCGNGPGDGGTIALSGTYSAARMDSEMTATIQDGGEEMSFTAVITSERSGECSG